MLKDKSNSLASREKFKDRDVQPPKNGGGDKDACMWSNSINDLFRVGHGPIMQTTFNYQWLDKNGL
ncbi:MAG TPA: hypothetical protein VK907_14735 [Phnomibacter sp.]|nr:hypothetical protein [Phnomibacter sp.]